jgi:hypothetical protein
MRPLLSVTKLTQEPSLGLPVADERLAPRGKRQAPRLHNDNHCQHRRSMAGRSPPTRRVSAACAGQAIRTELLERLLRRQGTSVLRGTIYPPLELPAGGEPARFYQYPGLHRAPGQVEHPRVRFRQGWACLLRAEASNQGIAMHAAAHVALQHEDDPAKHLPLGYPLPLAEVRSNACSQGLIECHRTCCLKEGVGAPASRQTHLRQLQRFVRRRREFPRPSMLPRRDGTYAGALALSSSARPMSSPSGPRI